VRSFYKVLIDVFYNDYETIKTAKIQYCFNGFDYFFHLVFVLKKTGVS